MTTTLTRPLKPRHWSAYRSLPDGKYLHFCTAMGDPRLGLAQTRVAATVAEARAWLDSLPEVFQRNRSVITGALTDNQVFASAGISRLVNWF